MYKNLSVSVEVPAATNSSVSVCVADWSRRTGLRSPDNDRWTLTWVASKLPSSSPELTVTKSRLSLLVVASLPGVTIPGELSELAKAGDGGGLLFLGVEDFLFCGLMVAGCSG